MIYGIEEGYKVIRYLHKGQVIYLIADKANARKWKAMAERDKIEHEIRDAREVLERGWSEDNKENHT